MIHLLNQLLGRVMVPTTVDEYNALVKVLVKKYKLPNSEHASVVIGNSIRHLPPHQAMTTYKYLGHCVLKNMAYQLAGDVCSKITHKTQIDNIVQMLMTHPNDQQAIDALEAAAKDGSEYAKEVLRLSEWDHQPRSDSIVQLVPNPTPNQAALKELFPGEDTAPAAVSPDSA